MIIYCSFDFLYSFDCIYLTLTALLLICFYLFIRTVLRRSWHISYYFRYLLIYLCIFDFFPN